MTGGSGQDQFIFSFVETAVDMDRGDITDFNRNEGDSLNLFSGFAGGVTYTGYNQGFAGNGVSAYVEATNAFDMTVRLMVDANGDLGLDWWIDITIACGGPLTGSDLGIL